MTSAESRFDLAYGASHALALAALRRAGYRSEIRALVFQTLPVTLGIQNAVWRGLATAHEKRNLSEYEGWYGMGERVRDGEGRPRPSAFAGNGEEVAGTTYATL